MMNHRMLKVMRIRHSIVLLFFLFLMQASFAGEPDFIALQGLGETRYHRVELNRLEQTYHIYVRLPEEYKKDEKYPTVYLLDGGITYPILAGYYHYLRLGEELPVAIIVGISYGTDDWNNGNMRGRDFTAKSEERSHWGGAGEFLKVLREEIFPLIENRYAANPDKRIIFGQSLGGQFVLYAALTSPNLFWGYIASNPALHRNLDFFLQTHGVNSEKNHLPKLFVSSGSEDDPRFRKPALTWIKHWQKQPKPTWSLKTMTLEDQTHFSAAPAAFRQGLRWIFTIEE